MSDFLWPHELQHSRPPCPTPTPRAHPNSCPLSQWCHPTVSSSVVPFSSSPQSYPASGSFPMSQLFTSGGQSIGVSASISNGPMNTQDWYPLGWTGWISLHILFTHLSIGRYLCCFHGLAIINSPVVDIDISFQISVFILSKYTQGWGCWIIWDLIVQFLVFWGITILYLIVLCQLTFPPTV